MAPYLFAHFQADDFFCLAVLEQKVPYKPLLGFWTARVQELPGFHALWWMDMNPNLATFFRPLPSLVVRGFYELFGRGAALPLHAFFLILHGLVAYSVFRLFLTLTNRYAESLLAGLLFLICEDHSMTVGWIATGTDILAVGFMNLTLIYHFRYRRTNDPRQFVISTIFLLLALGCKETAVVTPVAIVLAEWLFADGRAAFGRRWPAWLPSVAIGLAYLSYYKFAGFGTHNLLYTNPLDQPLTYLRNLATSLPVMLAGFLSIAPIGLTLFKPELLPAFVILGLALFAAFLAALYPLRRDRDIQFCLILFLVALLPQLSTDAAERLLYYPFVPGSFLIARLIGQARTAGAPRFTRWTGYYLAVSAGGLALVLTAVYPYSFRRSMEQPERLVLASRPLVEARHPRHIVYLNTPGSFVTLYVKEIFRYHTGQYQDIQMFCSLHGRVWVRQVSDRTFLLRTDRPGWLSNPFARVTRIDPHLIPGQRYVNAFFTATIRRTTPDRKDVLEVQFDFNEPLDNPNTLFLCYDGQKVLPWQFGPTGQNDWQLLGDSSGMFADKL